MSEHWTEFNVGDARLGLHTWNHDGTVPAAVGVRVFFEVDDLSAERDRLHGAGVRLRGDIVELEGTGRILATGGEGIWCATTLASLSPAIWSIWAS